jgi:hypothetical protein
LRTSPWIRIGSNACLAGLLLLTGADALSDPPAAPASSTTGSAAATDLQSALATGDYFSSAKQAFSEDFNKEVVRGHFDIGTPPDTHRFYCLVNAKTGKGQLNAVGGETFVRSDGMTGLKSSGVAPLSCVKAEQLGVLVTTGYVLKVSVTSAPVPPVQAAPAAVPAAPASAVASAPLPVPQPVEDANKSGPGVERVDVAGLKLGMSPDQVRAVFKARMLSDYYESTETLHAGGASHYVNLIAAWTSAPRSAAADGAGGDGESFEVLFTPVPGKERVLAIIHSTAYSPSTAIHATGLSGGLVAKYRGYAKADELPPSPTWRVQSDGSVLIGDECNRRSIFGGLGKIGFGAQPRSNPALKTTTEEFRYQIDHCGVAIVTEDDAALNPDAPLKDRLIARFTVTAYSPTIGFEGATTAAQLMQAAGSTAIKSAARDKDSSTPRL